MTMRVILTAALAVMLIGCKANIKPEVNDDTIVTSQINGVTLVHRHIIQAPNNFAPINSQYKALYAAGIINRPEYGGKIVDQLKAGQAYTVLGEVQGTWSTQARGAWIAIANDDQQLIGYVPNNSMVKSELYDKTVKEQSRRRPRVHKKVVKPVQQHCVNVNGNEACQKGENGTWMLD